MRWIPDLTIRGWEMQAHGTQVTLCGRIIDTANRVTVLEYCEPAHIEPVDSENVQIVVDATHQVAGMVIFTLTGNRVVLNAAFRQQLFTLARVKLMDEAMRARMELIPEGEKTVFMAAFITTKDGVLLKEALADVTVVPGQKHQLIWEVENQKDTWSFTISGDDLPPGSIIVPEAVPMRIPRALVGIVERLKERMLPAETPQGTPYPVRPEDWPSNLNPEQSYPTLAQRHHDPAWHESTVSKSLEINAAHWLPPHNGKCRFVHGHNYTFDVKVHGWYHERGQTTRDFFVVEFATLNEILKDTVGSWDHMILAHYTEAELDALLPYAATTQEEAQYGLASIGGIPEFGLQRNKFVSIGVWTTAENLSRIAAEQIRDRLDLAHPEKGLQVEVTCWETPRTSATTVVNSKSSPDVVQTS